MVMDVLGDGRIVEIKDESCISLPGCFATGDASANAGTSRQVTHEIGSWVTLVKVVRNR